MKKIQKILKKISKKIFLKNILDFFIFHLSIANWNYFPVKKMFASIKIVHSWPKMVLFVLFGGIFQDLKVKFLKRPSFPGKITNIPIILKVSQFSGYAWIFRPIFLKLFQCSCKVWGRNVFENKKSLFHISFKFQSSYHRKEMFPFEAEGRGPLWYDVPHHNKFEKLNYHFRVEIYPNNNESCLITMTAV